MKKIILATAILLAASFAAKSQETAFGFGYNMQTEWFKDITTATNHGFYLGVSRDIEISDIFAFCPTLTINSAYGKVPGEYYPVLDPSYASDEPGRRRYWSLNLPLLFKAGTDFSGSVRGFIQAGPNVTFGLIARDTRDGIVINYYGNGQYAYSRWNIGVSAGLGIDIRERHRISANYTYGFLDASKIPGITDHTGFLTVGYAILFY